MRFDVVLTSKAERQLREAAQWWATHRSADEAARWFKGFAAALQSLARNPERCSPALDEGDFPVALRELHFGLRGRATHRAVFTIRADRVVVYSIRHFAQQDLTPDDL